MILHGLLLLWLLDPALRSPSPVAAAARPDLSVAWFELVDVPSKPAPTKPEPAAAKAAKPSLKPEPKLAAQTLAPQVLAVTTAQAEEPVPAAQPDRTDERSEQGPATPSDLPDGRKQASQAHGRPKAADYVWDVLSHLQPFQHYPERARRRGESGTVLVRARVSRRGVVLASEIIISSGSRVLDQAALDLLTAASPLPKPPPGDTSITELELPITYRLDPP